MEEIQLELENLCESNGVTQADQVEIYEPLCEMMEVLALHIFFFK